MTYFSRATYTSGGAEFNIVGNWLNQDNIVVTVNGVTMVNGVDYTINTTTNKFTLTTPVASGVDVTVERTTPLEDDELEVTFTDGSFLDANSLNRASLQNCYQNQELRDDFTDFQTDINADFAAFQVTVNAAIAAFESYVNGEISSFESAVNLQITNFESTVNGQIAVISGEVSSLSAAFDALEITVNAFDARITSLEAQIGTGGSLVPISRGGTNATTASDARYNLGLGSMAVQDSSNVAITGGTISGVTVSISLDNQLANNLSLSNSTIHSLTAPLAIVDGGTGAGTVSDARSNLGLGSMAVQASSNVSITGGAASGLSLSSLSSPLEIASGGTSASTKTAAFDALSPLTTKGDLIVSSGSNNVRLGVGTNDYVLTADSTATNGIAWKAATGSSATVVRGFQGGLSSNASLSSGSVQTFKAVNVFENYSTWYDTSTGYFTPTVAGRYLLWLNTRFYSSTNAGVSDCLIYKNSTEVAVTTVYVPAGSYGSGWTQTVQTFNGSTDYAWAGHYVGSSGWTLNYANRTVFAALYLGPSS